MAFSSTQTLTSLSIDNSDLNLHHHGYKPSQHVDLASRKRARNRAQIQPIEGPKWAFGKALREFRTQKGISQEELAEAAGLDRSFVSLVERGIQSPNVVVLLRIAAVLKVKASVLIARTEAIMDGCASR